MKKLSKRQSQVLELAKSGMPSKAIADSLGIAFNTVCCHRKSLFRKLGVLSMAQAIAKHMGEK